VAGEELKRLEEDAKRTKPWKRWGPYLSERQWSTVREDYSPDGTCWEYFPHDHARSRAYRWGEDGLLGICDRQGRLCFGVTLWNGQDPILKERLFGLTGSEGNHGEDVKELYFYADSTPTHSYMKGVYKYPHGEYPYKRLIDENRGRSRGEPEFELLDTGLFDEDRYFDVDAEYAKSDADDIFIRLTVTNRGPEAATVHLLPTLWFRNTWAWGRSSEGYWPKPRITRDGLDALVAEHSSLGTYRLEVQPSKEHRPEFLFTDNETNTQKLFNSSNKAHYCKDAFHEYVVQGNRGAVNLGFTGTKAAIYYRHEVPAGGKVVVKLRLCESEPGATAEKDAQNAHHAFVRFDDVFAERLREADEFYASRVPAKATEEERRVYRQGYSGLLWTKQFFYYVVREWLEGDPNSPKPPESRDRGRNWEWPFVHCRDVISMPDKWEYPWFAAWDLAFHMLPFARIDPSFAKEQLLLLLREWYMHPNGQLPAYEFAFSDVNPPVHAWAAWRIYKMTGPRGHRDRTFLARVFQKLLLNFTWWVNRKDREGNNLFSGGFLGLDNVGVFDRSRPLPTGGHLAQADGTAWMAFYCSTMLAMALELAREAPEYEDVASKFFEHFVAISDAMNTLHGSGLWHENDGFYYDQLVFDHGEVVPLTVRSMVGIIPLFAAEVMEEAELTELRGFTKRTRWFLENRQDLAQHIAYMASGRGGAYRLLAIPSRERLQRVLRYVLDENEFLSPYGVRSLSRKHKDQPFIYRHGGEEFRVDYVPGESNTGLFGGNSNWRGPVWFPVNYLLVEALERYYYFYGDTLRVECPTGSGNWMTLKGVAKEISRRLVSVFLPDEHGVRPCYGTSPLHARFAKDPAWKDLLLFHEYFDGDTGLGLGANHQTGWTALVVRLLDHVLSDTTK
jgi:hypothetical protein